MAAQPVFQPELDTVLQCPTGQQQGCLLAVSDRVPWVETPQAAGQEWLARPGNRDEFATVVVVHDDNVKAHLLIKDRDGSTTGMVYLLVNTFKGWTLQGANVCRATDAS